jgi:predicted transcriptional regulator
MATTLKPETEVKLKQLASRMHLSIDEVLDQAVDRLLAYNDWFEGKVKKGLAAIERGEIIADEEVRRWLESREAAESDLKFDPVEIAGEPLSATILRDRR